MTHSHLDKLGGGERNRDHDPESWNDKEPHKIPLIHVSQRAGQQRTVV